MAFDLPVDESSEDAFIAPAYFLETTDSDPAGLLEHSDWKGHEQSMLDKAMLELDDRSRDILESRWLEEKKSTLHELAARYNVSAERIRQLEKNAMKKLREGVVLEV